MSIFHFTPAGLTGHSYRVRPLLNSERSSIFHFTAVDDNSQSNFVGRRVEQTHISAKEQRTRCANECQKRDACRARHLQALICLPHSTKRLTLQNLFHPPLLCTGIPYTAPKDCFFRMCIFVQPNSLCFWHTLSLTRTTTTDNS